MTHAAAVALQFVALVIKDGVRVVQLAKDEMDSQKWELMVLFWTISKVWLEAPILFHMLSDMPQFSVNQTKQNQNK